MDGGICDEVIVVQDQHKLIGKGRDLVQQKSEKGFADERLALRLEPGQCPLADVGPEFLQCRDEVGPEAQRSIVALVQRESGHTVFILRNPFAQQRRFTEAGRSRDQDQRVGCALDQSLH